MAEDTVNQRQNAYLRSQNVTTPTTWGNPAVVQARGDITAAYFINPQNTVITYGAMTAGEKTMCAFIGAATGTDFTTPLVIGW